MSRQPLKVRCSQMTTKGEPCRGWAVRGTDPPTCSSHLRATAAGGIQEQARSSHLRATAAGGVQEQARSSPLRATANGRPQEQACSSHLRATANGRPQERARSSHLRATAKGRPQEQACSSHLHATAAGGAQEQARSSHLLAAARGRAAEASHSDEEGFYGPTLSEQELTDLVVYAADMTLADEIACTRVAVRRTLDFLSQGRGSLSEADFLRAAGLVFQGARTIARLLRDQQALVGDSGDRLTAIFDAALDELGAEWGIEL